LFPRWQCAVAFWLARTLDNVERRGAKQALYALLTLATLAVFLLGVPAG
jgi:hypothetical protein